MITVNQVTPSDWNIINFWRGIPEISKQLNTGPVDSNKPAVYFMVRQDYHPVGFFGLFNTSGNEIELGLLFPVKISGLLTWWDAVADVIEKTFDSGFDRIITKCWDDNKKAIRCAEKAGFKLLSSESNLLTYYLVKENFRRG